MTSRTITTRATAHREAVPESATVDAVVVAGGGSASDARAVVADRASTLHAALTDGPAVAVRTVDLRIADTDETFGPEVDAPFQATERLHVECPPANAESVVITVTDAGNEVREVTFGLHDGRRTELRDEAGRAAMERARERAERMAAAEGCSVGAVREATTVEASDGFESLVDEALGSRSDAAFHPEPITISAAVEVEYALLED